MIYLNAEVVSGLGEDTFWTWFKREFPTSSFETPTYLADDDCVLRYSTLGNLDIPGKQIALLWELHPEMKIVFNSNEWDKRIEDIRLCAKLSTYRTVASSITVPYYEDCGSVDIIPIAVNTDLYKPLKNKMALRDKYNIPRNKRVGFWGGTTHPMKGFQNLKEYAKENPDIYWILVWKMKGQDGYLDGHSNFVHVSQEMMSELMNCADFALFGGLLRSFYMIEWEAMACDLPVIILNDMKKDFVPSKHPRDDVFKYGWDRISAKKTWVDYLSKKGISW